MTEKFKPLLACTVKDTSELNYPVYVSVKADGIRSVVKDGVVYSRTMKPIPSEAVQKRFGKPEYEGFDGELVYGNLFDKDVFIKSTSFCMSKKVPEGLDENLISFFVFDIIQEAPYRERLEKLTSYPFKGGVYHLSQTLITTEEELLEFEKDALSKGAEGVMVRSPNGRYKQGRSTLKEGILGKVKRFADMDCVVVDFEEKMHNTNEAKKDALGYTERSTSKDGMVPAGTLGALVVESEEYGRFSIGTGFDDKMRKEIWDNKASYLGKLVKVKYFPVDGGYKSVRFPVFLGFRSEIDI